MGVHRRAVLWGTAVAASLAGCTSDEDDGTDDADGMAGDGDEPALEDGANETDDANVTDGANETDGGAGAGAATPTVQVTTHDEFGSILVDGEGATLYQFDEDLQGSDESACSDDCVENWPPLTVEAAAADDAVSAGEDVTAELTTFERTDGDVQVAANGWPLYHYVGDEAAGEAQGQGVGGIWWVLRPDGTAVRSETGQGAEQPG